MTRQVTKNSEDKRRDMVEDWDEDELGHGRLYGSTLFGVAKTRVELEVINKVVKKREEDVA